MLSGGNFQHFSGRFESVFHHKFTNKVVKSKIKLSILNLFIPQKEEHPNEEIGEIIKLC